MKDKNSKQSTTSHQRALKHGESGFTLIETAVALVVMMVGALAMSSLFVFSAHNNVGGNERALAMAVAQQHLEQIRSVNFNDSTLASGTNTASPVRSGGREYTVGRAIEDETNGDGSSKFLKKITITVTPLSGGPNWVRTPVVLVTYRSSGANGAFALSN